MKLILFFTKNFEIQRKVSVLKYFLISRNSKFFIFILVSIIFNFRILSSELQDKKNIDEFIDSYFSTWSNKDMEGYESCFHTNAIIHFESNGIIKEQNLSNFIEGQKLAHEKSIYRMKEIPLSKKIQIDNNIAQVTVRWRLTSKNRDIYGYDYFTLLKLNKKWKIIYLIFNND